MYDYGADDQKISISSISFMSILVALLQVAFVVLRLCNIITWSWWLVLLPVIIYFGLGLLLVIIALILLFIYIKKERY